MRNQTVLVVDDERSLRDSLADYLTVAGYEVLGVGESEEAQAILANLAFDFIVTDLRLSSLDHGGGLLVVAAARERSADARVVVITGCEERDAEVEAMRLGADLFLRKPFALAELVERMDAMSKETTSV